jgi:RHS repeat-associated protein
MFGGKSTFELDHENNQYVKMDSKGGKTLFHANHAKLEGRFKGIIDPKGNKTTAQYNNKNQMTSLVMASGDQTSANQTSGYHYEYQGDTSTSPIKTVSHQVNGQNVRRCNYAYYGYGEAGGVPKDLKTAQVEQFDAESGTWLEINKSYYRYYTTFANPGFPSGLKFVVGPEAYARMLKADIAPETATDSELAGYADYYFEYDAYQRVTHETVDGGAQSFTFAYTEMGNPEDDTYNTVAMKTVETLPDGSQNIVYTNAAGQVILKVFQSEGKNWYLYYQFDHEGKGVLKAESSAVAGYDENNPALVILKPDSGLIHTYEYYTNVSDPGYAPGYVKNEWVQQGSEGTPVLLQKTKYATRKVGNSLVYLTAAQIVYQSDAEGGSAPAETDYDYTFFDGALQVQQQITTLPVVPASQNGSGKAVTTAEVYDPYGRVTWAMDGRGFITYTLHDVATGSLIQKIDDVDTSVVSGAPAGWSTPPGGGLNLVTDYQFDLQGRITQELDPVHTVDLSGTATALRSAKWTVYRDDIGQQWQGNGYATGSAPAYAYTLINPVTITQTDQMQRMTDAIQAIRKGSEGALSATDNFPQPSWTRWAETNYDNQSLLTWQRTYFDIPSRGSGGAGTNYDQTDFGYDAMGRKIKTVTPAGTITRQVLSPQGLALSTWVGTKDHGATPSDPTGGGAAGNNMVQIDASIYDNGNAGGDGNLTLYTQYASATDTRATSYGYDFRNRKIYADGEIDFYQAYSYDNVDRLLQTDNYDTTSSGNLIARSATAYDTQGRAYQNVVYGVDPATGTVGNALTQNLWYDPSNNPILNQNGTNEGFTKTSYDGINRMTASYSACNPAPQTYATAGTVASDTVVQQTVNTWDPGSNLIFVVTSQRDNNATGTGALNGPNGDQPQARVSYVANYPDPIGRQIASANYGTNGGLPVTYRAVTPTPSDTILVSYNSYNDRGELNKVTDPQGTVTQSTFDDAARLTQKVENYQSRGSGPYVNKTTSFTYNANGKIGTLTATNAATGSQVTTWVYGTSAENSEVVSNELLQAKLYPDSTADNDRVVYGYNRLGQVTQRTDQNGTERELDYDKLGRLEHDRVTRLGSGVDGTVRKISRGYDVRGLLEKVSSHDGVKTGSGNVVNEVKLSYNSFQQLEADYQSHSGAVDASTPKVGYVYADGHNNTNRLNTISYPNGRALNYAYGPSNSIDDLLDRVTGLSDTGSLVTYTRLGLDTTVVVGYVEPSLQMTYLKLAGEPVGDGGDQYTGLDRFNRVVDVRWINRKNADVNRFKYGFSRASNRLWRQNVVASQGGFDEQYTYDGLYQVDERKQGTLNSSHVVTGTPVEEEQFKFDPTGNWPKYQIKESGATTLDQSRTHQTVNEITEIDGSGRTVGYDGNGNMTKMPAVSDWSKAQTLTWDAWDRLITISQDGAILGTYQYDGLKRRIWKQGVEGGTTVTRDYYYSNQWQVLEERTGPSAEADTQYVWGIRYEDDIVLRDRFGGTSDRMYALADYFQPTALADASGAVKERYVYRAFGNVSYYDNAFKPAKPMGNWTYLYGSYQFDPASALYQVRNRYYHAGLGRWLSRDPYVDAQGNDAELTQGTNLYWYVSNNAVNKVDPLGLIDIYTPFLCSGLQIAYCEAGCKAMGGVLYACWIYFEIGWGTFERGFYCDCCRAK